MEEFIKTQFWLGVIVVIANMIHLATGVTSRAPTPGNRVFEIALQGGMSIWAAYLLWAVQQ